MKILIPIIQGNSGSDVYFQSLRDALHKKNIAITLTRLPQYLELAPPVAKIALFWKGDARNYDLVHTNGDHGSHFKIRGRPLVLTVLHNVFEENYQKYTTTFQKLYHHVFLKRYLYRALDTADKIVAISLSTKTSLERMFGISNVALIYGGVDTDIFRPREVGATDQFPGKVRLLFVGNLTRRKGADLLPHIMEKLGRNYVLFYTSGLRKKGILAGQNMVSLGSINREKLVEMYNFCDILLLPSRLEGFGYAAAEAMACGKPIVCTNCSSLPELVIESKGGFLCEQDSIEDFVEKIRILGKDEKLRQAMGQFNRQRILENFTVTKMAENYLSFYRSIVGTISS